MIASNRQIIVIDFSFMYTDHFKMIIAMKSYDILSYIDLTVLIAKNYPIFQFV